jgi:hypothetical protein
MRKQEDKHIRIGDCNRLSPVVHAIDAVDVAVMPVRFLFQFWTRNGIQILAE